LKLCTVVHYGSCDESCECQTGHAASSANATPIATDSIRNTMRDVVTMLQHKPCFALLL